MQNAIFQPLNLFDRINRYMLVSNSRARNTTCPDYGEPYLRSGTVNRLLNNLVGANFNSVPPFEVVKRKRPPGPWLERGMCDARKKISTIAQKNGLFEALLNKEKLVNRGCEEDVRYEDH